MAHTENPCDASTTSADTTGTPNPAGSPRRYRARIGTTRDQRVTPRFTGAELSAIRAAADAAQMTVTGFCALAALALARREPDQAGGTGEAGGTGDGSGLTVQEWAEMQRELFAARTAVNRTGVNLNQAVAALNATGQPPVWLQHAVDRVARAVAEVDAVAAELHRRLA